MVIPSQTPWFYQQIQSILYSRFAYHGLVLLLLPPSLPPSERTAVLARLGFEGGREGEDGREVGVCFAVVLGWCLVLAGHAYFALCPEKPKLRREGGREGGRRGREGGRTG